MSSRVLTQWEPRPSLPVSANALPFLIDSSSQMGLIKDGYSDGNNKTQINLSENFALNPGEEDSI